MLWILLVIVGFIFLTKKAGDAGLLNNVGITMDINELTKVVKDKLTDYNETQIKQSLTIIEKFHNINFLSVPPAVVYGILYKESGRQILDGKENNEIPGYDGKSIGYFQITKWPVLGYNQKYGTNYQYEYDAWNEELNIKIGMDYLNDCWKQSGENIFLTGKKYNGGLDETMNSDNDMAETYGRDLEKRVNMFISIMEKINV